MGALHLGGPSSGPGVGAAVRPSARRRRPPRPDRPAGRGTEPESSSDRCGAAARPADRKALGRSRGGLTTKIHLLADAACRPLVHATTAGQRHDSLALAPLLQRLKVHRRGPGRPRTRPDRLLADKAYSNRKTRAHLRRRGIKATIPEKDDPGKDRPADSPSRQGLHRWPASGL